MRNLYIFIIWPKAMFKREKILADLKKHFKIVSNVYIKWSEYEKNLKAFYGHKIVSVEDKLFFVGKGKFNLIVVEDLNPKFEERDVVGGKDLVNALVFDLKDKYRKWTGRDFRVHSSQNNSETVHDLTILLGERYMEILENAKEEETINIDTIAINKVKTIDSFESVLDNLDVIYYRENDIYHLYSKCSLDLKRIFNESIILDNKTYQLDILGEMENQIPEGLCLLLKDHLDEYLSDKEDFYHKYNLNTNIKEKSSLRKVSKLTFKEKLKKEIRYIIARFKY